MHIPPALGPPLRDLPRPPPPGRRGAQNVRSSDPPPRVPFIRTEDTEALPDPERGQPPALQRAARLCPARPGPSRSPGPGARPPLSPTSDSGAGEPARPSPARHRRAAAGAAGAGLRPGRRRPAPASCAPRGGTRGPTFPGGRRRRLPCAQSRAPSSSSSSSSAPRGRLMVPPRPPALPAARGSRWLPRDAWRRVPAGKRPGPPRWAQRASRSPASGCLQCRRSRSRSARGPGGGVPGPATPPPAPQPPPRPPRLVPPLAGPAPSRPRPPPPGPRIPPAGASRAGPAPLQAAPTFLAFGRAPFLVPLTTARMSLTLKLDPSGDSRIPTTPALGQRTARPDPSLLDVTPAPLPAPSPDCIDVSNTQGFA